MIKPHKKSVSYEASKINNLCSKKKYQIKNTNVQVCLAVVQPLPPRLPFREFAMFLRFYEHREKYKVITKTKAKKNLKYNLGLYEAAKRPTCNPDFTSEIGDLILQPALYRKS